MPAPPPNLDPTWPDEGGRKFECPYISFTPLLPFSHRILSSSESSSVYLRNSSFKNKSPFSQYPSCCRPLSSPSCSLSLGLDWLMERMSPVSRRETGTGHCLLDSYVVGRLPPSPSLH